MSVSNIKLSFCFIISLITVSAQSVNAEGFKFLNSTIEFADSASAATTLATNDYYTGLLTKFDVQSRLQDTHKTTEQDYLDNAEHQTLSWNNAERLRIKKAFDSIAQFITANNMVLELPPVIQMIKTTGKEEYNAEGYTRTNHIILKQDKDYPTGIVAHELFHVFSRYDERTRNALYGVIGFKRCNPIDLSCFHGLNITNPDCPTISHYITVDGEDMTLVLYGAKPYAGGNMFEEYMKIGLLELELKGNNRVAKLKDSQPVILELKDVPDIFDQIGRNTPYLLHPEEIMAENFAKLVTGKQVAEPIYLQRIKYVLTKN